MYRAPERSKDLGKILRTPLKKITRPKKISTEDKITLPHGWKVPGFFTAMTLGAEILIEESSKPIMPSAEEIKEAFPRIKMQIIERFNRNIEDCLPGYGELCR